MKRIIRFLCLTLLMLVSGMAYADNAAKVGDTEYATLQEAINAAEAGQTVTLVGDVALEASQSVSKTLTLDLNGHTVNFKYSGSTAAAVFTVEKDRTFTVVDNSEGKVGKITTSVTSVAIYGINAQSGSTVNFQGGSIEGVRYGILAN